MVMFSFMTNHNVVVGNDTGPTSIRVPVAVPPHFSPIAAISPIVPITPNHDHWIPTFRRAEDGYWK